MPFQIRDVIFFSAFFPAMLFVSLPLDAWQETASGDKQVIHTAEGLFTTRSNPMALPLPKSEDVFQFVIYGDRTGGRPEGIEVLKQAVNDTNLLDPDFVLTVGDLIEGYNRPREWMVEMQEYRDTMQKLNMAWFPVAGNHDIYWDFRDENRPNGHHEDNYEKHFGPLWYSFEHKNSAFIVLYTDEGDAATGEKAFNQGRLQMMSDAQLAFLKEALQRYREKTHVFVALHHPRWIGGGYAGSNWPVVHKMLVDAKNVTAVFGGHIHRMRYDPQDGIDYYALATTGGHLNTELPEVGYLHHFNVVTVRPDGMTMATVPVGAVMDPKKFTPEFLTDATAVQRMQPSRAGDRLAMKLDGTTAQHYSLSIPNPGNQALQVTVTPDPKPGWQIVPDHQHITIPSGKTDGMDFYFYRSVNQGAADAWNGFQMPTMSMSVDYLHPDARIHFPAKSVPVDITLAGPTDDFFNEDVGKAMIFTGKVPPSSRRTLANIKTGCARIESEELGLPQGPFTLEAWVFPTALNGSRAVVAKTQSSEFALFLHDGVPTFDVHLSGSYVSPKAKEALPLNQWTHMAGVYDGQNVKLYLNGQLMDSKAGSGDRKTNNLPLFVGADPDGYRNPTRPFAGKIDEVRLSKGVRYQGNFQPAERYQRDGETVLLLHLDRVTGPFLHDDSQPAANVLRFGDARITDR